MPHFLYAMPLLKALQWLRHDYVRYVERIPACKDYRVMTYFRKKGNVAMTTDLMYRETPNR